MKKLFLILIAAIAVLAIIFWRQINRARLIVTTAETAPLISFESYPIPIEPAEPIRGNPGAALTIVAFVDINQDASKKMYRALTDFVTTNPTEARMVWKDLPERSIFSDGDTATQVAAWCAAEQNRFWDFADSLAGLKNKPNSAALLPLARALKLNLGAWQTCLASGAMEPKIGASSLLASQLGIKNPPALFINNKRVNVDEGVDLEQMLKSLIAE